MERRNLSIMVTKKKIGVTILSIVIIVTIATRMILTCTYSKRENTNDDFYESVNYNPNKDLLSFTIPKTIPEGCRFYLHVSGRKFMGDKFNGMSFHAFDEESLSYTWENGKTYTYPLDSNNLDYIILEYGLLVRNNEEFLYTHTIHIYPDGTKIIDEAE